MKKQRLLVAFLVVILALSLFAVAACDKTPATKLEVTASSTSIVEGKTTTLTAKSASSDKIDWSVSDETVLKIVNNIGKICTVSGLKPGSADVIATQGEEEARCTITVTSLADQPRVEISYNGAVVTEKLTVEQDSALQLTAATVNTDAKVSTWSSSDNAKATVSENGVVTGVLPGTVTITAAVNSSLFADIQVEVVAKQGSTYYDLKCGEEAGTKAYNNESQAFDGEDLKEDEYFFWMARAQWSQQDVKLEYAYFQDGEINVKYTSDWDPGYWYGFQIFYKNSEHEVGKFYKLSCKINVNVDCKVTLNDTPLELKAGDNEVEVFFKLTAGLGASGTSSFDLALGCNDGSSANGSFLKDGTVAISDIAWEEIASFTKLQAPSFTLNDEGVITITDPNAAGVGAYNLGFFQGEENKGTIEVENGEKIDTSTIEKGTYTVRIQAVAADIRYHNSDFSETSAEWEVTAAASYALPNTSEGGAVSTPGKWTYWSESWVKILDNNYSDGVVTIGFSNNTGNWYDMQLFYEAPENIEGKIYKMSFDLQLDENISGRVTLNGQELMLNSGKNHYEVVITESSGASFAMIFGLNGQSNQQEIQAATVVISNLKFEEAQPTPLVAPSFEIDDNNVITITDTNNAANVAGYVLGFFTEDNTLVGQVAVKDGEAIDLSAIAKGTYTVRLLAKGANALYTDSQWSTVSTTLVSTTENPTQDIAFGTNSDAVNNPGTWYNWFAKTEYGMSATVNVSKAQIESGVVTVEYTSTGSLDYGVQLFYHYSTNEVGKTYKLTLKATSTIDNTITVNGKKFDLKANVEQEIEVEFVQPAPAQYDGAAISIQVPVKDNAATFTLKDVAMTEVEGVDPGPGPIETVDQLDLPVNAELVKSDETSGANDTLIYWFVEGADWNCGSVVTMNKAEYKDGVATLSYVGGSVNFSVQLFYKSSVLANGKTHKLTLNINASAAGTCRVNGKEVTLVAGDNAVAVEYTQEAFVDGNSISSLDIQFWGSETEVTYAVSNVKWVVVEGGDTPVDPDENINIAFGENGILWDGSTGAATTTPDTWYYWVAKAEFNQAAVVEASKAKNDNGVITVTYNTISGELAHGVQLFYHYSSNVVGKTYKLTLKVTSTIDNTIQINNQKFDLKANVEQEIVVEFVQPAVASYVGASISIQVPVKANDSATLTLKDVTMTEVEGVDPGPGPVDPVDQLDLPADADLVKGDETSGANDTLIYWFVEDANWGCGSAVTMNKAEYKDGVATLSYVGGSVNFSVQLFYKSSVLANGKTHKLTLNINASAAGTCRVNGKEVTLVAGDNEVAVEYTQEAFVNGDSISSLDIQFWGSETEVTYAVSNVKWAVVEGGDTPVDPDPVKPDAITIENVSLMEVYGVAPGEYFALKIEITDSNRDSLAAIKNSFNYIKIDGQEGIPSAKGEFLDCGTFYRVNIPAGTVTYNHPYAITLYNSEGTLLATINYTIVKEITPPTPVEAITIENASLLEVYGAAPTGQYFALKIDITDENRESLKAIKANFGYLRVDGKADPCIPGANGEFLDCGTFYRVNIPVAEAVYEHAYVITIYNVDGTLLATINYTLVK